MEVVAPNAQDAAFFGGAKHGPLSEDETKQFLQREAAHLQMTRWFPIGGAGIPGSSVGEIESMDMLVWPNADITRIEVTSNRVDVVQCRVVGVRSCRA